MATGRVVVVGLGPGGADLLVPAARAALERARKRFVRTARHPVVADLAADGLELEALDDRYEEATDLEQAYRDIASTLVAAALQHGEVAYAVPGSPSVAERTLVLREYRKMQIAPEKVRHVLHDPGRRAGLRRRRDVGRPQAQRVDGGVDVDARGRVRRRGHRRLHQHPLAAEIFVAPSARRVRLVSRAGRYCVHRVVVAARMKEQT